MKTGAGDALSVIGCGRVGVGDALGVGLSVGLGVGMVGPKVGAIFRPCFDAVEVMDTQALTVLSALSRPFSCDASKITVQSKLVFVR